MANITKIYELRTLGYDVVIRQLSDVEEKFINISRLKKALNEQKLATSDTEALIKINEELTKAKIKYNELRLQKQQLVNQALVIKNAQLEETNSTKAQTEAIKAEAGALTDLINKKKLAEGLLSKLSPGSTTTVNYNGTLVGYQDLVNIVQVLNADIEKLKKSQLEYGRISNTVIATEIGGLKDLIARRQQLQDLVSRLAPGSSTTIEFDGSNLSREQAINLIKEMTKQVDILKKEQLEETNSTKAQTEAIKAEAGALTDLINKKKLAEGLLSKLSPGSTTTVNYNGTLVGYQDLVNIVQVLNSDIEKLKKSQLEYGRISNTVIATEIGGLKDLIARRQQLQDLVSRLAPGSSTTIEFDGSNLSREQAINLIKEMTKQVDILKKEQIAAATQTKFALENEVGGYNDIIAKQKELYALIKAPNANSGTLIPFQGQLLSFDQAIAKFKELSSQEQAFRRQFQQDATLVGEYSSGIVKAFQRMGLGDLVGNQVNQATKKLRELNSEFERLKAEMQSLRTSGDTAGLQRVEAALIANRKEADQLDQSIKRLQTDMRGMGTIGQQVSAGLSKGFQDMKGQLNGLLLTYVGFFAAFRKATEIIQENARLSDSFSDLQIRIKGTRQDVEDLFNQIKTLDTRTSLESLVDIANIVAKKGVAKDEIVGITGALDKLFIVLGKEAGDPQEATASIVKLISIFNEDKRVTADRVNEIGTSLVKLTTSGVATGAFLIDFAERVGAVRGITGLTLPLILGMGAALEQLGQRAEVAGTAAIQLTTKLFSNVPKFAQAAKLSVEEFRALLEKNPFEGLIKVAENLAQLSDPEIAQNFEEVNTAFGEVGVVGVRVKAVLGDIATNGKFVQERMKAAAVSTDDLARSQEAASLKQRNFAATLDLIKKKFEELGTNENFRNLLLSLSSIIVVLLSNIPLLSAVIITLIGLTNTAAGSTIRLTAAWALETTANALATAQIVARNTVTSVYTALTIRATAATGFMAVAMRVLAAAVAFVTSPLGIAIAAITALLTIFGTFSAKAQNAADSVSRFTDKQRLANEVQREATKAIQDTITKEQVYLALIKDENIHIDTRKKALNDYIDLLGEYGKTLDANSILTDKGVLSLDALTAATARYNTALLEQAKVQTSINISNRENQKLTELLTLQRDIKTIITTKEGEINLKRLEDIDKALLQRFLNDSKQKLATGQDASDIDVTAKTIAPLVETKNDEFAKALDIMFQSVTEQIKVQTEKAKNAAVQQVTDQIKASEDKADSINVKYEVDIESLKKQLDAAQKLIDQFKGSQSDLDKLIANRDNIKAKLDAALREQTKTKEYRGARIPGEEKDEIAEINARTRLQLAAEERRYAELQVITVNGQRKLHKATFDEEVFHLQQMRLIELGGLDDKIQLLSRKTSLNAKEKELLATFHKDKADLELKYLKDLQSIHQRQYDIEAEAAKKLLEARIAFIEENQEALEINPNVSEESKARARKLADDKIVALTKGYYVELLKLADKYSIENVNITEEMHKTLSNLKRKYYADDLNIAKAMLKDAADAAERFVSETKARFAQLRTGVLQSDKSQPKKAAEIENLDRNEQEVLLAGEVARYKIQLALLKQLQREGKATQKEVDDATKAYEDAVGKQIEFLRVKVTTLDNIRQGIQGFAQSFAEQLGLTGDAALLFAESFQIAEDALNSYFDSKRDRIEKDNELEKQRIDLEYDQRKQRAQSEAERISLDKQAAELKHESDKKAFERQKKLQLTQLKLNFAVELSNIALAAAANPLNPFTFGAAGIAQYLIMAALATIKYTINRNAIASSQLAFGGSLKAPDTTTNRGGFIKGRSHDEGGNPFTFKGRQYEDEVDEIQVIRTRNVRESLIHTISGTQAQIASKLNVLGGGKEFKPGGTIHKKQFAEGGILGSSLTAPQYTPSSNVDLGPLTSQVTGMGAAMLILAKEQSERIDRLEVTQTTRSVRKAISKEVNQESVGLL